MENLIQQAEIALQNGDLKTAETLYFQIYEQAMLDVDFENVFFCLQKLLEIFPNEFKEDIVDYYYGAFSQFLSESQENQQLSNLQNLLQYQQNNNVNLRFVISKILFYQAQSAETLAVERQKLLRAKELIHCLNFEQAQLQKISLEAYLLKNTQKSAPPPYEL